MDVCWGLMCVLETDGDSNLGRPNSVGPTAKVARSLVICQAIKSLVEPLGRKSVMLRDCDPLAAQDDADANPRRDTKTKKKPKKE